MYAPTPGQAVRDNVKPVEVLSKLLDAMEKLLIIYGFSAKRTAGWGIAAIDHDGWKIRSRHGNDEGTLAKVTAALPQLLDTQKGGR